MKLLIKGGWIVDPAQGIDEVMDLLIENGCIEAIGREVKAADAEVFDATGLVVMTGLIDMHVHLREPGLEAKEDILSGTQAAANGGFTTVACMPNTRPIIDNAILVTGVMQRAQEIGRVNVKVIGAVSKGQEGKELAEIGDMIQNGAVAVSDDGRYIENAKLLKTALEYTGMFNVPIISHAEDESLVEEGVMHEGAVSAMLGMKGRPAVAEDIAVARDIMLAEYAQSPLHVAHVSTKGAVDLIRQAKRRGVKVTAEVTPHHLTLTDEMVKTFDTATKVNPPLRSQEHVEALIAGLKDGTIDAIATDHAPHAFEEKDREYRFAPSGFSGLETALGVVLTHLYHTNKFSLSEIVERMSRNPSRILGIQGGTLGVGNNADIAIVNPNLEWTVNSDLFYTKSKHTPFANMNLKGKVVATLVKGNFVMKNSEVL